MNEGASTAEANRATAAGERPAAAIVGAGWVANHCYAPALRAAGVDLLAVVDVDVDAARRLADLTGAAFTCQDIDELPSRGVELVVIAAPNHVHVPLVRCALDRTGAAVLCEKPLAPTRAEAAALVARGGSRLGISVPYRFRADAAALLAVVRGGVLGTIHRVRVAWTRARGVPRPGSWYTDARRSGGGVLADLGPHLLDFALLLMGSVQVLDVNAWTRRALASSLEHRGAWMSTHAGGESGPIDVEDQALASFMLDRGRIIELHASWAGHRPHDRTEIEVEGDRGRATLDTLFGYSTAAPSTPPQLRVFTAAGVDVQEFSAERLPAADFGQMVRAHLRAGDPGGGVGAATGQQALQVIDMIERAYSAARRFGP